MTLCSVGNEPSPSPVGQMLVVADNVSHLREAASMTPIFDPATTLIRMDQLLDLTGLGRATIYKLMRQPESGFPKAVKLTASTARGAPVAWVLSEVQDWVRQRIALRNGET
jgi:prophage regulatory protein